MNLLKCSVLLSFLFVVVGSAAAQTEFSNSNVEYTFTLPDDDWKSIVEPSAASPNVEYVHKTRNEGHFEIRKISIGETDTFGDMYAQDEQSLQFLPGYVAGKSENFTGALSGKVYDFEFARSGKNMSGRYYYLKSDTDKKVVYVVRFTGFKDSLRSIRNQTDSIARTFKIKSST